MIVLKAALAMTAVACTITAASAQDAAKGAALFKQRCSICHVVEPGKKGTIGPNLLGVVGRKAGSQSDFPYSPAMKKAPIVWSKASLDTFLTAPNKLVPGTRMVIAIPVAPQRADIVAYLSTLSGK
ncbi:cytochrome c family protein [soil metagenome]|jgi:cytochrome c|uniref:c-type cytochrome n=2 Tax=unclassified Sphingobium TaxID=2611147 RepID=UPI001EF9C2F9|nr:c-type cytochrome [Sphingobium sp. BS19]GLI97374.1 cytochrome c [Sphingobium sp. BS19]CAH0353833.1 Cytochrome c2 [Sphingobium sp. CECT 9361]|tara:strand:+ start:1050 stop:1427 length:378 start_codon:yes stop_codon:yes gene_type:complete